MQATSGDYLLCIAPAVARAGGKQMTMKKYSHFAGRFDGHGNALLLYRVHHPMKEAQGFGRSLPL